MATSGDTAQTLSRGIDVLTLIAASPQGKTPSQVAAELGLSRTIVYRLVSTLVEHGLVRRRDDGLLTIGVGALRLSENVLPALRESTRDILERLAEKAGATAHLCVADGQEVLAVSVVEPQTTTFHVAYRVGSRTPLGVGALGQAIESARAGQSRLHESEGQLIPGAHGIVASLPDLAGALGAVGVVTLAGVETAVMRDAVQAAADELAKAFEPA